MSQDMYHGFADANRAATPEVLHAFLEAVDALPEFQAYKRQLRPLLALQPGDTVLDIGCGIGIECCKLAQEYPGVSVIGLDREAMLTAAARRAEQKGVTVRWLPGRAEEIPLPDASVDACLVERMLMYLPDPAVAIAEIARVLKPGGRVALFELDYESALYGGDPAIGKAVAALISASVSEARMGRRLPGLLYAAGLRDVTFEMIVFRAPWQVFETTIAVPVREAIKQGRMPAAETTAWLEQQAAAIAAGLFSTAFIGFLVGGRSPKRPEAP